MDYPTSLDDIDQWLFDSFEIIPGACASTENLRYNTARMVAEALWPKAVEDLSWHPSTEHPPVDEEVIVLTDIITKGGLNAGFGKIAFGHVVDKDIAVDYDGWNIEGVRYWMPMPEIPKEEKK